MTAPYEVLARLERLEMNTSQEERMLAMMERIMDHLGHLTSIAADIADIAERLRDVVDHLEAGDDEPDPS